MKIDIWTILAYAVLIQYVIDYQFMRITSTRRAKGKLTVGDWTGTVVRAIVTILAFMYIAKIKISW